MRFSTILPVLPLLISCAATSHADTTYTVTVANPRPSSVHVAATFPLDSENIDMMITQSAELADGQAAFVRNLEIRSAQGSQLAYEYRGEGTWTLTDVQPGQTVTIDYDILLEHDQYSWRPGIDEVAYRQDDGLFFTGFSLFLVPGLASDQAVTLRFDLPEGWHASTPWRRSATDPESFRAANPMDLLRNCLFLGSHLEKSLSIGDFTFVLALGGELPSQKELFIDVMEPLLPAFVETFGGMPRASRYLVVINQGNRSDGGAFLGSYSLLIRGEVNQTSRAVWGHGIAHELLHFWNGQTLVPTSPSDEEWLKEGFTDYLTLIHLSRSGLDSREVTYRKLENMARRYTLAKMLLGIEGSMRAAGAQKHRNRFLVYGGGSLVALALDVRLRQATDNRAGLDELMRAMYSEFGATNKPYSYADVVRLASQVAGRDQSEFFDTYVAGTDFLDIGPSFDALGLQLTQMIDEFYLSPREHSAPEQRAMARAIFGSSILPSVSH